jgi:hypothetical protein
MIQELAASKIMTKKVAMLQRHLANSSAETFVHIRRHFCLFIVGEAMRHGSWDLEANLRVFLGIFYPMKLSARIANDMFRKIVF